MIDRSLLDDLALSGSRPASPLRRVLEQACTSPAPCASAIVVELTGSGARSLGRLRHGSIAVDELEAARAACALGRAVTAEDERPGTIVAAPLDGDGFAVICRLRVPPTPGRIERVRTLADQLALAIENERLSRLRRRLVADRVASEQRALAGTAYDLHDGAAQKLLWVRNTLAQLARDEDRRADDAEALDDLRCIVASALTDVLDVISHLNAGARPGQRPLSALLREEAELLARGRETRVAVETDPELDDAVDASVALTAYRLAQEAMGNALRHGCAANVTVTALVADGRLHLCIDDDGCGFEPAAVLERSAERSSGLGLRGMHERVALVGGEIAITSRPGATCVRADLPTSIDSLV
jgi:signal transduction histidine kinase